MGAALPGIAALVLFHFVAIGFGAYYAFTSGTGSHACDVGRLRNLRQIISDQTAQAALRQTLILAGCFTVIVNTLGLALALALNRAVKTRHFLRRHLLRARGAQPACDRLHLAVHLHLHGALNRVLSDVGLDSWQRAWTGDPSTALWTILVVMVWQFTGLAMVIYLAGLQGIPTSSTRRRSSTGRPRGSGSARSPCRCSRRRSR